MNDEGGKGGKAAMTGIRKRTAFREGKVPGQPEAPRTDPLRIRHRELGRHWCAECFKSRSGYRRSLFCSACERVLFGGGRQAYQAFLRSERARRWWQQKRAQGKEAGEEKMGVGMGMEMESESHG